MRLELVNWVQVIPRSYLQGMAFDTCSAAKGESVLDRQSSARQRAYSSDALSRRKIIKRALGVTAVGAAGGSLLSTASTTPAAATTVEQGGMAPAVVTLQDGPTIAVDASLGNDFRVTLAANRTMGDPSNSADGQQIIFQVTQDATGSRTLTYGSAYEFGTDLPSPTLTTAGGQTDLLGFIYNAAKGKWLFVAFVNGFS